MPALAYRTSILPFSRLTVSNRRSRSSRLAASPRTPVTFRPISLTASSSSFCLPPNVRASFVERLLPPAHDENIGAFFNEPLGARQRHAARSTRDDCNLTLKLSHDLSFQAPSLVVRGSPREPPRGSAGARR